MLWLPSAQFTDTGLFSFYCFVVKVFMDSAFILVPCQFECHLYSLGYESNNGEDGEL